MAVLVVGLLVGGGLSACSGADTAPLSMSDIAKALDQHAAAVRERDRAAFLAGVSDAPSARAFRAAQSAEFANLREIPLTTWSYQLAAPVGAAGAQASARQTFGATARIVKVTLTYAITGVDPVPTSQSLWWTFARVGGAVVICADNGLALVGGVSWQGPWDFGPLAVVRGAHSLVLGPAGQQAQLKPIADVVDQAVPAVTAVWGSDWSRDVEVIVPSSSAALDAALGESGGAGPAADSGEPADVAAVAVSDGIDPVSGRALGQRVVVEQSSFDGLSPIGRQIVFTHEVTHIASAAVTGGASPRWLVEGLAEYVAYLHAGQPVRAAASELVTQLRTHGLPNALPGDSAFDSAGTVAAAYEQAWLACRLIASEVGSSGLIRFYTLVGESGMSTSTAVATALQTVLHQSLGTFTADWRAYLREQLG